MSYFRLLANRNVLLAWSGQVFSSAGDRLYSMAALWIVYQLTNSASLMALTQVSEMVAFTVAGLVGGALADRFHRLRMAIFVDVARGLLVMLFPLAYYLGVLHVWMFACLGSAIGALTSLFGPAFRSFLPTLCTNGQFAGMVGLMDTPSRLARILGPGMAGILLLYIPIVSFYWIDSATFAISAVSLQMVSIRLSTISPVPSTNGDSKRMGPRQIMRDIREGTSVLRGNWYLLALFRMDTVGSLVFPVFTLGSLVLATKELHIGVGGYGWLVGGYGVGSLIGNFFASTLSQRRARFWFAGMGWTGIGGSFVGLGFTHNVLVAIAASVVAGVFGSCAHVSRAVIISESVPNTVLGKLYSFESILESVFSSLGTVLCGWMLDATRVHHLIGYAGILLVLVNLLFMTTLRQEKRAATTRAQI